MQAFAEAMQEAMDSPDYRAAQEVERQQWQELADAVAAVKTAGDELELRHFARPETIEDWEHLARIVEIPAETIKTGNLTAREIFACALAWVDRQKIKAKLAADTNGEVSQAEPAEATSKTTTPTKAKRSTEKGEGQAKLIAALTKHHKYADGSCLNLAPVGNNELARLAEVSESTASAFFNRQFGGHTKYRAICSDATRLVAALKLLNQEFSPHHLFGAKPPGEDGAKTKISRRVRSFGIACRTPEKFLPARIPAFAGVFVRISHCSASSRRTLRQRLCELPQVSQRTEL